MSDSQLYFAYSHLLDPDQLEAVCPSARFLFTAHYPETAIRFVSTGDAAVATLNEEPGATVWGAVFDISKTEVKALIAFEREQGRIPGWEQKAVDRAGNKHDCLTFVSSDPDHPDATPATDQLTAMIRGARHWDLPAGWIVGLEDLAEDPLLT